MSFPVGSEHAAAPAAVPAPRTLRNSRRLTPPLLADSLISVVAVGAVIARLLALIRWRHGDVAVADVTGRALSLGGIVPIHVAVHTPTHVQRRVLVDAIHLLHFAVTRLAGDADVHVPHVREADVLGNLMDANPRHRLSMTAAVVLHQLLDFRLPRGNDEMAAHARRDGGHARV